MSPIPPALNTPHTRTLHDFTDTGKVFSVANGVRKRKYVLDFEDGYRAELCLPENGQAPELKPYDKVVFRVAFRPTKGNFPDEINILEVNPSILSTKMDGGAPDANSPLPVNYNGTAASIAVHVVKDLYMVKPKTAKWTMKNFLADCLEVENWIKGNRM